MEVDRLPVGVIPRIEGTTVFVEFIGENEDHLAAVFIRWDVVRSDGCIFVNQPKVSDVRYLSSCIGVDAVPTVMGELRRGEMYDYRIASTGGDVVENWGLDRMR